VGSNAAAIRLFITCWLIFGLHVATNTVREIYLALAIGDRLSFRVDEYGGMHPDLFETPGRGWHIGNNPGASMLAAIPYALARPVIDRVVAHVNAKRRASGAEPPAYESPWPMAQSFFQEAWRRGFDLKFGLAAIVMQVFCMAPISAAAAVLMFRALETIFPGGRTALWMALLYAFGTPLFFRTGYLNQNMLVGHFAFAAFALLWNPWGLAWTARRRFLLAGLAGGVCLLLDYSGAVALAAVAAYGFLKERRPGRIAWYAAGAAPPVLLLWFYQWASFGHPFYPGQHWMPPVQWIERGYQGVSAPQLELLWMLAFDYRFGLFVTGPVFLLAFAAVLVPRRLPGLELYAMLGMFLLFWVFFSGVNYTRLQSNTGIRYLAPVFPFLFVPAAVVLARLPARVSGLIGVIAVAVSWCLAMHRDVERGLGVLDPVLHVFLGGFKLPLLTTLGRIQPRPEFLGQGVSPLPLFALTAAVLYVLWRPKAADR
jgi:hypothetical protein